jgi:hypothetical protein
MRKLLVLTFGAALTCLAAEPLEVRWQEVCKAANGNEIAVETSGGDQVKGYCVSISVDEMSVRTADGKVVKLARSALRAMRVRQAKSHQLRALGKGFRGALHDSVDMLFSPLAPVGAVGVPGTIAWGAAALPFCALRDLHDWLKGSREIKVI